MREPFVSNRVFSFKNNGRLNSEGKYFILLTLAGNKVNTNMNLLPLLLSKKAMKKAGIKIYIKDDMVIVFGRKE